MAAPLSPERLVAALKKFNVDYELWPGWKTRTRPGGVNVVGFMIHHTAGGYTDSDSYMKFLFETGRPSEGIPGPLCNFSIGGSGKVYVGSLGRTNNAGMGSSTTLSKVRSESYSGYSSDMSPGVDNINGNSYYWGVEICYGGPGAETIKPAQYKSAVKLAAAIVDAYGWQALSILGHKEHSRRKSDPRGFAMHDFRKDVRALLNAEPTPEPKEWWEMAIPSTEVDKIAVAVAREVHGRSVQVGNTVEPLGLAVGRARNALRHLDPLLRAWEPLLEAAAQGKPLTAEQVKEIADACAAAIPAGIAAQTVDELKERL